MEEKMPIVPDEIVMTKIYQLRDHKIMLDYDLAELYGVDTKVLKQAVRRNAKRFPGDFMFELTREEFENLRSQIVTSKSGGTRYMPMAFTEHGVLMLSSVLRSDRAIEMNIQIMRIFTKMKEMIVSHSDLILRFDQLEKKLEGHDHEIVVLFEYLKKLMEERNKELIRTPEKELVLSRMINKICLLPLVVEYCLAQLLRCHSTSVAVKRCSSGSLSI